MNAPRRTSVKEERQYNVLIALIEHYIETGKPVGSNTLKETGLNDISSATIRNYFANLEEEGYLEQQHASGGRIPTEQAFRFYAQEKIESKQINPENEELLLPLKNAETKEVASFLQRSAEILGKLTDCAVFMSAPRFDQDFIIEIKLVHLDAFRILCAVITDFGVIQTEIIRTEEKMSAFAVKRLESYIDWRLSRAEKPDNLSPAEEALAQKLYNELMVRYIVGYSNFIDEEIFRTGFSKLLSYPEFHDPVSLATNLSLFENAHGMRLLLRECMKTNRTRFWIGGDLNSYATSTPHCAVAAIPYRINQQTIGAVGILGPSRMPYPKVFGILHAFSEGISEALTRNIFKFKINFRQPQEGTKLIGQSPLILLEDKT